ncbi:MAG: alpha/beta hydrolase [Bradyrhizobium sp.]|nr:alpha/beta hydrolase [Bradyrhizobium sp.]
MKTSGAALRLGNLQCVCELHRQHRLAAPVADLQGRTSPFDPLVSPLQASDETLARFPPTLLQVSNSEFLLWDAQQFAAKLIAGGVRTLLSVWAGMPHVWQIFPFLPEADAALAEAATFLNP